MITDQCACEQVNNCILLHHREMGLYLPKNSHPSDLVEAIQTILAKQEFYASQVSKVWDRIVGFGAGDNAYGPRRAVKVVETVAQNGYEYLLPEICRWPLYQQFHLDIIAFFIVATALTCWFWRHYGYRLFLSRWCTCTKPILTIRNHAKRVYNHVKKRA